MPRQEIFIQMLRKSSANIEHPDLPAGPHTTGKRAGQVPLSPFNAAMIPLQFGIRHEEKIHPQAVNPLPSADMAFPSSRPPSQTVLRSSRQSPDSGYDASISSSNANPSPRASNLSEPNQTTDIGDTNISTVEIGELIGDQLMSTLDTVPSKWTLTDMINHIIGNDIILPTEEEIDGNRAANATALPPIVESPAFYDKHESAMVDFARANPGRRPFDDLQDIGGTIRHEDLVAGQMKKRDDEEGK
ncbi:MAG: hypothetical protein LQ339_001296 [Xanthoria mediterranea]|nr:MAG: hypothetical protein LQ339_001296 [Xanthoria mediterranea]